MSGPPPHDLVLSSGFLAFARQAGVLAAIEAVGPPIDGVCGTSSGALAGALWAAGMPAAQVAVELSSRQPWQLMRLHGAFWRGLFSMGEVIDLLGALLPATFSDLQRPFAVGVRLPDGSHGLVSEGPLAPAVAASCAMPVVFAPVELAVGPCQDGGAIDRVGLDAWRAWRGLRPTIVHQVDRTAGAAVSLDLDQVTLIRTPRSGARFWNLGDFEGQRAEAEALATAVLHGAASRAD